MKMHKISDLAQIRALASPLRQSLVDLIEASGPISAAQLASLLDCAVDGLYYHLRILTGTGWIVCRAAAASNGREMAMYEIAKRSVRLDYKPRNTRNRGAVTAVVASMFRDSLRAFKRAYAGRPVVWGPRRDLWAGRKVAWLTGRDLEQLNVLLGNINRLMESRRGRKPRAKLISFSVAISEYGGARRTFESKLGEHSRHS